MSILNLWQPAWILQLFWCVGKSVGDLSLKRGEALFLPIQRESVIVRFHVRGHSYVSCDLFRCVIREKQQSEFFSLPW